jgi:diguanylate cyclase
MVTNKTEEVVQAFPESATRKDSGPARTWFAHGLRWPTLWSVVAFAALYLAWQITRFGYRGDQVAIGDLSFVVVLGLAIVGTEGAARRCRPRPRMRRSWHLISLGLGFYLLANAIQGYREVVAHELSYPSLADACYLSFYVFFFAGIVGFAQPGRTSERTKLALDVLIVAIPASMVLWYAEAGASVLAPGQNPLLTTIAIAYPVGDLLLLVAGVTALLRGVPQVMRTPLLVLLTGVVVYVVTDAVYGYILLHGIYHGGDHIDSGWMVATVAFAAAAALQPAIESEEETVERPSGKRAALLPYVGSAVGFSVLLVSERNQPFFPVLSLVLAAVLLALAVTLRQVLAQRALQTEQIRNMELVDQLRHQAFHDPLTGLANRALFAERLAHALQRQNRSTSVVAVLMLDLDEFKTVNDTLGHDAGDQLLSAVADRLRRTVRPGDTVARFGGDEFAIVLEDLEDPTTALATASRILSILRRPVQLGSRQVSTSASIGITLTADVPTTADQLLREADTAMYAAKVGGRDRHRLFEAVMREDIDQRAELTVQLRGSWDRGELSVAYQPILDLRTGQIKGLEALARWQHPTRGSIPPGVFIRLAEELGLIHELDSWVLVEACRRLGRWEREHPFVPKLDLHVNISARELLEPDLVPSVRHALQQGELTPKQLTLELVESSLVSDSSVTLERLNELKAIGVRIAIDDFGTGYSSLSYLQRLPIDVLKIDRSFISEMNGSESGSALVHALVQLGGVLGLEVVAEGIENLPQLQQLKDEDCGRGQGFLFSHPLASAELDAYFDLRENPTDSELGSFAAAGESAILGSSR